MTVWILIYGGAEETYRLQNKISLFLVSLQFFGLMGFRGADLRLPIWRKAINTPVLLTPLLPL